MREIEKRGKNPAKASARDKTPARRESYYDEMELALREALGRKVKIALNGSKGTLTLEFYNREDLGDLAKKLT